MFTLCYELSALRVLTHSAPTRYKYFSYPYFLFSYRGVQATWLHMYRLAKLEFHSDILALRILFTNHFHVLTPMSYFLKKNNITEHGCKINTRF